MRLVASLETKISPVEETAAPQSSVGEPAGAPGVVAGSIGKAPASGVPVESKP